MKPNHLVVGSAVALNATIAEIPASGITRFVPAGVTVTTRLRNLDIGEAVAAMERGQRVRRAGWNGKGMHLELQVPDAHSKMSLPYVFMFTACKNRVPWLCSQTDLLAKDWEIVADAQIAEPVGPIVVTGPTYHFASPEPEVVS